MNKKAKGKAMEDRVLLSEISRQGFFLPWLKVIMVENKIHAEKWKAGDKVKETISVKDAEKLTKILLEQDYETYNEKKHCTLREIADSASCKIDTVRRRAAKYDAFPIKLPDSRCGFRFVTAVARKNEIRLREDVESLGMPNGGFRTIQMVPLDD